MNAERWGRVSELFDSACELPPDRRKVFLDECCQGDAELRCEVESLLNQNVSIDSALERAAEQALAWDSAGRSERHVPRTLGHYRIHRLVGEGGMGVVYEAEQENPRRRVALKVLRSALASPELVRRFAQESEVLGRLQHPGIARIYEAGAADTELGPQPYFAMEFIPGSSLLEYARQRRLSTRERVNVMIRVCEGVDHAHQHGIIHRDLKPGNILVDESGQPKILDFGVARITDNDANLTRQTNLGELVGTLAYMSPEQVLADPAGLDARSDVYALGVVLYELLAGHLPYEVGRQVAEAARVIRDEDPARLSSVSRVYRGDIETIVSKALEKDKPRRYASAAELAADLRRYLRDEPILARPPSAAYQARKFVKRHTALVSATTAIFLALIAGVFASTRQAVRANRERDHAIQETKRADSEAAVARAVNDFLQNDLLAQAGAGAQAGAQSNPDPDLKVRTALDRAAGRIGDRFRSQPLVEAAIRRTIGLAYYDLSLYTQAQKQLERAADLRKRVLGPEHPDTLSSLHELADLYDWQGKYQLAEDLFTSVLEARRRVLGNSDTRTLETMEGLAMVYQYRGEPSRAALLEAEILERIRRLHGEEHIDTLSAMDDLGGAYARLGQYTQAEELLKREVELSPRVRGRDHPGTLNAMHNLAVIYRNEGKYIEADALFKTVLEARRRVLGEAHWGTLNTLFAMALSYRAQGRYAEAESLLIRSAEGLERVEGREYPLPLQVRYQLGELYRQRGRTAEAESVFKSVLESRRRVLGAENPYTAEALAALGHVKLEQRRYAEAEQLLREALDIRRKKTPDTWERYYAESMLGAALAGLGRYPEAHALLIAGYQGMLDRQSSIAAGDRADLERARRWRDQLDLPLSGRGTPLAAAARHLAQ